MIATDAIYRFVDFFALADTIRTRRLRFTAASTFQDKNEGVEILYNSLRAAMESSDGSYSGIASQDDAHRFHNILKQGAFVCSWTSDADSIALWSLYSADQCGVRISSTVAKLQTSVDDFASRNSMQSQFGRFGLIDGAAFAFVQDAALREVSYMDLRTMHENILRNDRSQLGETDKNFIENFELFTLKDIAFRHEGEIRGIVTCSVATPSGSSGPFSDLAPWLKENHLYVDIPADFVETVAIDPRCPPYKRDVIESYLRDHNISLARSKAFGYLPDELDFVAPKIVR